MCPLFDFTLATGGNRECKADICCLASLSAVRSVSVRGLRSEVSNAKDKYGCIHASRGESVGESRRHNIEPRVKRLSAVQHIETRGQSIKMHAKRPAARTGKITQPRDVSHVRSLNRDVALDDKEQICVSGEIASTSARSSARCSRVSVASTAADASEGLKLTSGVSHFEPRLRVSFLSLSACPPLRRMSAPAFFAAYKPRPADNS